MRATADLDNLRHTFSMSLRKQIEKQKITVSQLAKCSGISRSVLSSYVSNDPGLPNAINILRLSQSLHCEPGIFFPKKNSSIEDNLQTEIIELFSTMISNSHVFEMINKIESNNRQFIYYVPHTLPEPLKTDAVFTVEYAEASESDLHVHIEAMRNMVNQPLNGAILIAEETLLDLMHLRGIYVKLSQQAAYDQIQAILVACHEHFPHWQIKVFSRQKHRIDPCFLNCGSFLLLQFYKYILKNNSEAMLLTVQDHLCEVHRDAVCFSHWHENHWPTFNDKKQSCDRRTTPRRPRETMGECDDREVTYSPEKPRS